MSSIFQFVSKEERDLHAQVLATMIMDRSQVQDPEEELEFQVLRNASLLVRNADYMGEFGNWRVKAQRKAIIVGVLQLCVFLFLAAVQLLVGNGLFAALGNVFFGVVAGAWWWSSYKSEQVYRETMETIRMPLEPTRPRLRSVN